MPFRQQRAEHLPAALADGRLDRATSPHGWRRRWPPCCASPYVFERAPDRSVLACTEHRSLAREAAGASMVLLRNEGALLPVPVDLGPGGRARPAGRGAQPGRRGLERRATHPRCRRSSTASVVPSRRPRWSTTTPTPGRPRGPTCVSWWWGAPRTTRASSSTSVPARPWRRCSHRPRAAGRSRVPATRCGRPEPTGPGRVDPRRPGPGGGRPATPGTRPDVSFAPGGDRRSLRLEQRRRGPGGRGDGGLPPDRGGGDGRLGGGHALA